ncbi:MAG: SET domain-containing protein-lysine N-methyltransferase [Kiritimatiellae bacterium]|nr:SET domain-containing protein-lysine N-methyltransferase [Kiritimatiellia bacterium]MDW8459211.1 SET domain-containing protein-lysine N-methyltransferase [Verrucomicrobiota bacterium]
MKDVETTVEARASLIHGTGVFARRRIAKGERIIEYTGLREKWSDHSAGEGSHTELMHVSPTHVINPREGGNVSRFINHSCDPNCEAVIEDGRVFFYALRDIEVGEELLFDYALTLGRRFTREDVLRYRCHCSSPRCRGTMLHVPPHRRLQVKRWIREAAHTEVGSG